MSEGAGEVGKHPADQVEAVARGICKGASNDPEAMYEGSPIWVDYTDEARAALDALAAGGWVVVPRPPELDPASVERMHAYAVTEGFFVHAVREHRRLYGSTLKDAVEAVRRIQDEAARPSDNKEPSK